MEEAATRQRSMSDLFMAILYNVRAEADKVSMRMNRKRIYRAVFLLWLSAVTVLSLIPSPEKAGMYSDKLAHFAAYFMTTSLCYLAFRRDGGSVALVPGAAVFLYSSGIEVLQAFLPYREFSIGDIAANSSGIISFLVILAIYRRINPAGGGSAA